MFGKKDLSPLQKKRLDNLVSTCLTSTDIDKIEKTYITTTSILYYLCQERDYTTIDYDNIIIENILPYMRGFKREAELRKFNDKCETDCY